MDRWRFLKKGELKMKMNKKKTLPAFLSLFMALIIIFTSASISALESGTNYLLDNIDNKFENWSNSINESGELSTIDGKINFVNSGIWPSNKTVEQVKFEFAGKLQGGENNHFALIYYYEDENNYKMLCLRESSLGNATYGLKTCENGVILDTSSKNDDQVLFNDASTPSLFNQITKSANKNLGFETGAIVTVKYLSSNKISFLISSLDGSQSDSIILTSDSTDFKSANNQKTGFYVTGDTSVTYKTKEIRIDFTKDITIHGNSVVDTSANEFEHFSNSVSNDGSVIQTDTVFSMNDGIWPEDKVLKSAEFNLYSVMSGDANKFIHIIYDYTDSQNYKCLEVRETGKKNLYSAFVDVVDGTRTKPSTSDISVSGSNLNSAANKDAGVSVGFDTDSGATVRLDYISSKNVVFTLKNTDETVIQTMSVTATAESGLDFKKTGGKFAVLIKAQTSAKFGKIALNWENDPVEEFRKEYADVLVADLNDVSLLSRIYSALKAYDNLSETYKSELKNEYSLLVANRLSVIVKSGSYTNDFEIGMDGFQQFADFMDKNGNTVSENSFYIDDFGTKTGGISQPNVSGKILIIKTASKTELYEQSTTWEENLWAINSTQMISAQRETLKAIRNAGKYLCSANFDLFANIPGSTAGVLVFYNYKDNYNFSMFCIRRGSGGLQVANYVVGQDENTGLRTRVKKSNFSEPFAFEDWSLNDNNWLNLNLTFNSEGKAVLTLTGKSGNSFSRQSVDSVDMENRMAAIGVSDTLEAAVDNFNIRFATLEEYKLEDFKTDFAQTLALNPKRVAPYDVFKIQKMADAFNKLGVSSGETYETVNRLMSAASLWDLQSDETIAESFKNIFNDGLSSDVLTAYNVYNRLTSSQKELLSQEYSIIKSALNTSVSSKYRIACVGDSITFGTGSGDPENKSYPTVLGNKLGAKYTVDRYGIPGIRVVGNYGIAQSDDITTIDLAMDPSAAWDNSHNGTYDIIIIQLGTNDLSMVAKNDNYLEVYKAGLEKMVHSYLSQPNSPYVILSDTPVSYSAKRGSFGDTYSKVALANLEIAKKYGLACVDIHAYTNAFSENEISNYYADDLLHFKADGYEIMAEIFSNAVKSLNVEFDNGNVTSFSFEENKLNSFLAPELISATIKAEKSVEKQDLGFKIGLPSVVKTGTTVIEHGMIFSKFKTSEKDKILSSLVYDEKDDETHKIVFVRSNDLKFIGGTYIAGLSSSAIKPSEAIIARSYIKFSDGSVYYSVNSNSIGSYENRTGVLNGYACRSVVSIAKAMVKLLAENNIDISEIATYSSSEGLVFNEEAKKNNNLIYSFITEHKTDIENFAKKAV